MFTANEPKKHSGLSPARLPAEQNRPTFHLNLCFCFYVALCGAHNKTNVNDTQRSIKLNYEPITPP